MSKHHFLISNFEVNPVLGPDDAKHLKSLRLREGDQCTVTNGRGLRWLCEIGSAGPAGTTLKQLEAAESIPQPLIRLHLVMAPTSNPDRVEWALEKCVELGISSFWLAETDRIEYPKVKLERLQRIAIAALKQSKQCWLPLIYPMQPLSTLLNQLATNTTSAQKFIAWLGPDTQPLATYLQGIQQHENQDMLVLIGPEGDFTTEEVAQATAMGYKAISLGPTVLRTETAGVAVAAQVALWNQLLAK